MSRDLLRKKVVQISMIERVYDVLSPACQNLEKTGLGADS